MLGVNEVVVKNGEAVLKEGGGRAGSVLTLDRALKNLMMFTRRPMEDFVPALSKNPAQMFGLAQEYGTIETGKKADLCVLDAEAQVQMTFVNGKRVF